MGSAILNLAGVAGDSIVDGPGLRFTVFSQGCPHRCPGCHNPETHPFAGGFHREVSELFAEIRQNPLTRGVTFSGGEPFCQPEAFGELAGLLKGAGYEVACYTGYTFEELLEGGGARRELLSRLDILVDGPFLAAERDILLKFRGSKNQRILNVPESLRRGAAVWETAPRWVG